MYYRSDDAEFGLLGRVEEDGCYWASEVDRFRRELSLPGAQRWPKRRRARAREIVEAYDAFNAECQRISDETGATAADERAAELHDLHNKLRRRIALTPARTMDGLRVKARATAWCFARNGEMEKELEDHLVEEFRRAGATGEAMLTALGRDLIRFFKLSEALA